MTITHATTHLCSRLLLILSMAGIGLAPVASAQEGERRESTLREREQQEGQNEEIRTVRRRLKVMRYAVDALLEAEKPDAADRVELAMHTRELAIKGVRNKKAKAVAEKAPNRGQLAELLGAASNLYEKWGKVERSRALADLAAVYGEQWRRQKIAGQESRQRENEQEGERRSKLDSLERRVHILNIAREAFEKAGQERNVKALANTVRYGKLALEGGNEEALARAAESVPSMGNLIELLHAAHNVWAERGNKERAVGCNQLAEYYSAQMRARSGEGGDEREAEQRQRAEDDLARTREIRGLEERKARVKILRVVQAAHEESGNRRNAEHMNRIMRLAELQLEGVSAEEYAKAAEGITQEMIIELVQGARRLYTDWGHQERAGACRRLAEFYLQRSAPQGGRDRDQANERERAQAREREQGQTDHTDQQATIDELRQQVARLTRELAELRAILRKLSDR